MQINVMYFRGFASWIDIDDEVSVLLAESRKKGEILEIVKDYSFGDKRFETDGIYSVPFSSKIAFCADRVVFRQGRKLRVVKDRTKGI